MPRQSKPLASAHLGLFGPEASCKGTPGWLEHGGHCIQAVDGGIKQSGSVPACSAYNNNCSVGDKATKGASPHSVRFRVATLPHKCLLLLVEH